LILHPSSRVKQLLSDAQGEDLELFISVINLGEVVYRVGKVKGEDEAWQTLDQIRRLPLTVVPAGDELVFAAVGFKMHRTISYAGAFAAAAADELEATLVTGVPELEQLEDQIQIEKLKQRHTIGDCSG